MAPHTSKGRLPPFIIYNSPFTIFSGPLPPLSWSPSPRQAVGGKIEEKKATPPLCLLVHPRLGVGGERSETEGGGFRRKL